MYLRFFYDSTGERTYTLKARRRRLSPFLPFCF
jgi:hypothetical protein